MTLLKQITDVLRAKSLSNFSNVDSKQKIELFRKLLEKDDQQDAVKTQYVSSTGKIDELLRIDCLLEISDLNLKLMTSSLQHI